MEAYERELHIARITAGKVILDIEGKTFEVRSLTKDQEYEAQYEFATALEQAIQQGLPRKDNILPLLEKYGIWNERYDMELDYAEDLVEQLKEQLYRDFFREMRREATRMELRRHREDIERLLQRRSRMDNYTAESYAGYARLDYILLNCTFYCGKLIDPSEVDIDKLRHSYLQSFLSSDQLRSLATSTPWTNKWPILKKVDQVFATDHLSVEQQVLLMWSIMYDNAYESSECPPDVVMQDPDAVDGWFIVQRKIREKGKLGKQFEDKAKKPGQEVYIPADTQKDADYINSLNDGRATRIKRERMAQIKAQGEVKEQHLKDVKMRRLLKDG